MTFTPRWTPLHWALGISVSMHVAILSLHIADPQRFDRLFQDTPMEVILVNTKATSSDKTTPQALAQTSLAGGGDADRGRSSSPLPAATTESSGLAHEQNTQDELAKLKQKQAALLSQLKKQLAQLPDTPIAADPASQAAREAKRMQLLKVLGEIEQRIETDNAKPRKRYVSPSTQEVAYAQYYDHMRRSIEQHGTLHFPQKNGRKLYGELTVIVTVNIQGQVLSVELVQSSGDKDLDARALSIARSAGPYGGFSADMRRQADQLALSANFQFTRDGVMRAQ